jgi:hypothetical protein
MRQSDLEADGDICRVEIALERSLKRPIRCHRIVQRPMDAIRASGVQQCRGDHSSAEQDHLASTVDGGWVEM